MGKLNTKVWPVVNVDQVYNNIVNILETGDIKKMRKNTYNFLYLTSGFIAHYNQGGFMDYYQDVEQLRDDLLASSDIKNPGYYLESFFTDKPEQADYYKSNAELLKKLSKYLY